MALFSVLIVILFVTTIIQVMGLGFLSESNIYTGDRFKFKYPSEYKITEVKGNSTFLIAKNTKNPNLTFQISKSPVNGTLYNGMSLEEYSNNLTNDFKSRGWIVLVLRDTLFLDNTDKEYPMYDISYHEKLPSKADADSVNGRTVIFDKDGIRYTIDFQGKGKQKFDSWGSIETTASFTVK